MASDPTVIERHALALHQKAGSRVARFTVFGVLIGTALGASAIIAPMVSSVHSLLPHRYAYAAVVMGAAAGAYLGYLMGQSRAVALRLQANVAVHQVEIGRALHRIEAMRLPLPAAASLPTPAPRLRLLRQPSPRRLCRRLRLRRWSPCRQPLLPSSRHPLRCRCASR